MYVGLDVGGTFLKGARIDETGRVERRIHEPIAHDSAERLLEQLARAVASLGEGVMLRAVGVGLPGIVDHATSRVRGVPNLPALAELQGMPLGEEMARRTQTPTFIENDANAAGLAEAWRGAGREAKSLLFVTLGTGVGGAVVLDGHLWTGKSGYAGEIGHVQLEPAGAPCGCGNRGCLETIVGNRGWARRAREKLRSQGSALLEDSLEPASIVEAAQKGDAVALEVVEETARALGQALGGALNLLNVERVVIGGGVAAAGPFLLERVQKETRSRCWAKVFADCSFRLAELEGDAGVVGAARVAMIGLDGPGH
jgi:glucokinase